MINKITDSVYFVGSFNPNLRVSDVIIPTNFGTSYNSYIIKDTKIALVETCHPDFWEIYLENIKEVCDPQNIDYIVINHTEPDHSGCLAQLLKLATNAKIVCSNAGAIYLKNIVNRTDLDFIIVKDNDELNLGTQKLKFISAPFLHWPDSISTYLENEKILFSCDFLGAHYCEPYIFDYKTKFEAQYEIAMKNYFDAIFGPFKSYVINGLDKISGLQIDFVCTSHGPVLTKSKLNFVLQKYREWSTIRSNAVKTIPIFYCSAYGNTLKLAEKIKDGIMSQLPDAIVDIYNIIDYDINMLCSKLNESDAFLIGSPTINRDAVPPVWHLLSGVDAVNCKNKNVAVFGSFGWSGEAVGFITERLKSLKFNVFDPSFKINFVPSENDLDAAKQFGLNFAKTIV